MKEKEKGECECDSNHHNCHCHRHSAPSIIIGRTIGFIVFIIFLSIASIIVPNINNQIYSDIVNFFNLHVALFIVLFAVGMISDIFWSFYFPFNMLAPITSSILSIFIVTFFYRMWEFINGYLNLDVTIPMLPVYVIVFMLVLVFGYITIMLGRARRFEEDWHRKKTRAGKEKEWEDVRKQFRLAFYDFGEALRGVFEQDKKKRRNKKRR